MSYEIYNNSYAYSYPLRVRKNHDIEQLIGDEWRLHPISQCVAYFRTMIEDYGIDMQFDFETDFGSYIGQYAVQLKNETEFFDMTLGSPRLEYCQVHIIIRYQNITITNEYGNSTRLGDVFVSINLGFNYCTVSGFRTKMPYTHVKANYIHSHLRSFNLANKEIRFSYDFMQFCTGNNTPMGNAKDRYTQLVSHAYSRSTTPDVKAKFDTMLEDWCDNIYGLILPMIQTESIKGGPYIHMHRIYYTGQVLDKGETSSYYGTSALYTTLKFNFANLLETCNFKLSSTDKFEFVNDATLAKELYKLNKALLYADCGYCYVQLSERSDILPLEKQRLREGVEHIKMPFKWNGVNIKLELIDEFITIPDEELFAKAIIPREILRDANAKLSSLIKRIQKDQWTATKLSSLTRKTEITDKQQAARDHPPIAYTPS